MTIDAALKILEGLSLEVIANPKHSNPDFIWVVEVSYEDANSKKLRVWDYGATPSAAIIATASKYQKTLITHEENDQ